MIKTTMLSDSAIKTKYFPFAPGIAFKVKSGRYLLMELSQEDWYKAFEAEEIAAICYGGLFESFFSFALLEVINQILPGKKLYWTGHSKYNCIARYNGLATFKDLIDEEKAVKYPTPLFFDSEGRTYINCLLNYINAFTFKGEFWHIDQNPVLFQIFRNILVPFERRYIPQLRGFNEPAGYQAWAKVNNFNILAPYVLIFPDKTGISTHNVTGLDWTMQDVKSFVAMVKPLNVVIVSNFPNKYNGISKHVVLSTIENIFYFIQKSSYILSNEIDYLLLSLLLSNGSIIYNLKDNYLNINLNKEYLKSENEIFSFENVRPIDAFNCVKKKSIQY